MFHGLSYTVFCILVKWDIDAIPNWSGHVTRDGERQRGPLCFLCYMSAHLLHHQWHWPFGKEFQFFKPVSYEWSCVSPQTRCKCVVVLCKIMFRDRFAMNLHTYCLIMACTVLRTSEEELLSREDAIVNSFSCFCRSNHDLRGIVFSESFQAMGTMFLFCWHVTLNTSVSWVYE